MSAPRTVQHDSLGPFVRTLDLGAGVMRAMGLASTQLTVSAILERAKRRTGLSDFGDERFIAPMRRILGLLAEQSNLTNLSYVQLNHAMTQAAENRLRIQEYKRLNPSYKDVKIERPTFVLGFPRSGTTVLQNLLAADKHRRGLEFWEIIDPIPHTMDPAADPRPRIRSAKRMLDIAYRVAPEMEVVHWIDAMTYEECWPLFANTFSVMNWDLQTGIAAWGDYITSEADMTWAYAEYKEYLQVLLHQRPAEGLVLKCPEHLWFIDELLATFPDAAIVWSHRDPYKTIASYCSLISLQWRNLYGTIPTKALGHHVTERFHQGVQRAMAARNRSNPDQFFDVRFSELTQDPAKMAIRILEHFDLPRDASTLPAMDAWLSNTRADSKGKHKYDPNHYGLDAEAIRSRYDAYIGNFGVSTRAA